MSAGPESHHDFTNSNGDLSDLKPPKMTASQTVAYDAYELKKNAAKTEKGSPSASEALLREALAMKDGPYFKELTQDLEKSGSAKITYGPNGDVEHIVFNGGDGKGGDGKADVNPVDIDLQHESVNGKSATQIKEAEVKQAKEYFAAGFSDPKMTDASGKPLSPDAQAAANALTGALLDGDAAAMTKAAQQIMQNPNMANSIQDVLKRVQYPSTISFKTDAQGRLYMLANGPESDAVNVPAAGDAYGTHLDGLGKPDYLKQPSLDTAMKSASDWSRVEASSKIDSAEGYLDMVKRLPADGYTNMKDLERAIADPHGREDDEKIDAMIQKELDSLTPKQKTDFDKLQKGESMDHDNRTDEE